MHVASRLILYISIWTFCWRHFWIASPPTNGFHLIRETSKPSPVGQPQPRCSMRRYKFKCRRREYVWPGMTYGAGLESKTVEHINRLLQANMRTGPRASNPSVRPRSIVHQKFAFTFASALAAAQPVEDHYFCLAVRDSWLIFANAYKAARASNRRRAVAYIQWPAIATPNA